MEETYTQNPVVLMNGVLIDPSVSTSKSYPNSTVMFQEGIITAVYKSQPPSSITPSAVIIDLKNEHSILPGLVGMHEHLFYPAHLGSVLYSPSTYTAPKLYLAKGITTARTTGSMHPFADITVAQNIELGLDVGPSIRPTAPYLDGPATFAPQFNKLATKEEAIEMVQFFRNDGFTNYKAYMFINASILETCIDTAHELNAKVTGHLCSVTWTDAINRGIDCLEHGILTATDFVLEKEFDVCPDGDDLVAAIAALDPDTDHRLADLIELLVDKQVAVTSTLAIFETMVPGSPYPPQEALDKMLPEARVEYLATKASVDADIDSPWSQAFENEKTFEKMLVDAGGLLLGGCDPTGYGGVLSGYGDHRSIELLVDAGFTTIEAIGIYSLNGATYLGEEDCIGGLRVGMKADVLVTKGNPAVDIHDITQVAHVFKGGIEYNTSALLASTDGLVSWV